MQANTAACPADNMQAERILGTMDALWRRAPNANIGFIVGKVKDLIELTWNLNILVL
uniref:Uncharacterized protein n=1 Tax=Arion vulgaris TaxID=1028688 RepID=A0A0B7B6J0_9EUPU